MNSKEKAIEAFEKIEQKRRREDALRILTTVMDVVSDPPYVYDDKSVGFGNYHYINKTNEGDMCILGITPAKAHITIYFAVQGLDPYKDLLDKLGHYKRGKICLYLSNFDKVNLDIFNELVKNYYADALERKKELGR